MRADPNFLANLFNRAGGANLNLIHEQAALPELPLGNEDRVYNQGDAYSALQHPMAGGGVLNPQGAPVPPQFPATGDGVSGPQQAADLPQFPAIDGLNPNWQNNRPEPPSFAAGGHLAGGEMRFDQYNRQQTFNVRPFSYLQLRI